MAASLASSNLLRKNSFLQHLTSHPLPVMTSSLAPLHFPYKNPFLQHRTCHPFPRRAASLKTEAISADKSPSSDAKQSAKPAPSAPSKLDFPFAAPTGPTGLFPFRVITRAPLAKNQDIEGAPPGGTPADTDSVILLWNHVLLDVVRALYSSGHPSLPGPPIVARAFGIFNACMFDAYAFYSELEGIVWPFDFKSAESEWNDQNREIALSFAALEAIKTIFPAEAQRAKEFLFIKAAQKGWPGITNADIFKEDPRSNTPTPGAPVTPIQVGKVAANAVLAHFARDGSNFPTYADTTSYRPFNVNNTDKIVNPDRWTPVSNFVQFGGKLNQDGFLVPHWGLASKIQFALDSPDEFRPAGPFTPTNNPVQFNKQIDEILNYSRIIGEGGDEGDYLRAVAEYWADGPNNETAPGIHILQASYISRRDKQDLLQDLHFFTGLGGILQDCAITAWDTKREYDNARMITSIRILRATQKIKTWGGPAKGLVEVPASEWLSYLPNPPFADHISGHSTFAGGAGYWFKHWNGDEEYGESFVFKAGTSLVEPGYPKKDIVLSWRTHEDAQKENGISRLYGGVHWDKANKDGQESGRKVAEKVANFILRKVRPNSQ
eukprot:TRINITY_DN2590_c0_g2_i2.p1 TRINITY_DN2590_c0_g2~~TRINITY_DN2590_c0_g2_i2.p1  ORF type:complete len:649 (-),score=65.87 TRINITY_DN2590_c0_g2_i2:250-2067(-)